MWERLWIECEHRRPRRPLAPLSGKVAIRARGCYPEAQDQEKYQYDQHLMAFGHSEHFSLIGFSKDS